MIEARAFDDLGIHPCLDLYQSAHFAVDKR